MRRRLHLATGLILFTYVLTHFINHSLGLVSLQVLEAGRQVFAAIWGNLAATSILYSALLFHIGSALWSLYRRRRLNMPPWEMTQILLGLSIPPLLILHILGTRFADEALGVKVSYTYILLIYFSYSPWSLARQLCVLIIAWIHGCIGLHFWLRLRPWYRKALPITYGFALLVPTLALAGIYTAGREVLRLSEDPAWLAAAQARIGFADAEGLALIASLELGFFALFAGLLALVAAGRWLRTLRNGGRRPIQISYPSGRRVSVLPGTSVLEASRGARIPHASVCGGRGRCSTCRVRIRGDEARVPPPSDEEAKVLRRIGALPDVRLACQLRPLGDIGVTPLLPPTVSPRDAGRRLMHGEEREIAVLFADMRDFTSMAENRLPYDVVFVLNRYFAAMGMAIEESGGHVDKFIGDGVMALFGVERGIEDGCAKAVQAAQRMSERLVEMNMALAHELPRPLRVGIGIHAGPVIVGEMGYGRASTVTAIGDTVNTASRLEAMTKELGAQLAVSEPVVRHAGIDLSQYPQQRIELRGRARALEIRVVENAQTLPVASPIVGTRKRRAEAT